VAGLAGALKGIMTQPNTELWYLHIRSLVGSRGIDHGEDTLAARKHSRRASDSSSSGTCLSPEALNINQNFFKTRSEMEGFI